MLNRSIGIVDYGMGNIHSVLKAIQARGGEARVVNDPESIGRCQKIVIPGVGAFDDAMEALKGSGLDAALVAFAATGKTMLGICLGMQVLFESSQEASRHKGLGIIAGEVVRFKPARELRVPHMGWNVLRIKDPGSRNGPLLDCPLLLDVPDNASVYFCHSYYAVARSKDVVAATTPYAKKEFASVVWQGNVYGMQFHPEKSQEVGMQMVENLVLL